MKGITLTEGKKSLHCNEKNYFILTVVLPGWSSACGGFPGCYLGQGFDTEIVEPESRQNGSTDAVKSGQAKFG